MADNIEVKNVKIKEVKPGIFSVSANVGGRVLSDTITEENLASNLASGKLKGRSLAFFQAIDSEFKKQAKPNPVPVPEAAQKKK